MLITGTRYALPHYELVRKRKKSENHWLSLGLGYVHLSKELSKVNRLSVNRPYQI
jgi:hypothetical protein